jgi:hypothetical protein
MRAHTRILIADIQHSSPSPKDSARERGNRSGPISDDLGTFLYKLGSFDVGGPGAFEKYAKTSATPLWGKDCILEDPSIQIEARSGDICRNRVQVFLES